MTSTPDSIRLHIVFTGERNSGKSSLMNAVTGQQVSIVSDIAGTTTDYVSKAMEIPGIGACTLIDTAGLDDPDILGPKRVKSAMDAVRTADILIAVIDASTGKLPDLPSDAMADIAKIPVIPVINKTDLIQKEETEALIRKVKMAFGKTPVLANALTGLGASDLLDTLKKNIPQDWEALPLTKDVVSEGELVVLVMPQDKQAPKGRLILPQQQTLRELLERRCRVFCCTTDCLEQTLLSLKEKPAAIITDSQDFAKVKPLTPDGTVLTSFSILLAASKGDIVQLTDGARKIDELKPGSKILIAEACTHIPASEDIGRVKLPQLLRKRIGEDLQIEFVSGKDFPEDLGHYDLVIHCGACMFNRRYLMSRLIQAKSQKIPITNYGVVLAYLNGIL